MIGGAWAAAAWRSLAWLIGAWGDVPPVPVQYSATVDSGPAFTLAARCGPSFEVTS